MEDFIGVIAMLVPIAGIALAFGIVYVNRSAKNRERMAMIEKGVSPEEISKLFMDHKPHNHNLSTGLLFVGAAIGILIGFFLQANTDIDPALAYITCAFLFGGVGMIIAHYLGEKNDKEVKDQL